jgi:hypothetical protein
MDQANPNSRPRRHSVKRWICAGLVIPTAIIGYAAYRHYVDPQRIGRLAEDYLERITQRKVRIASASFSFSEGINLRDVFVSNQPIDKEDAAFPPAAVEEVFSCHEISILQNSWALLRGQLEIESFAAIRPTLTLVHDSNSGWANVSALVRNMISRQESGGSAPPIELRHARVRILHRSPAGDREVEDVQLTVRGRRAADHPRLFNVVWQDVNDPDANGHTQIDLTTGSIRNVRGGLPTMSIRGVMLAVDAGFEGADALTDLLGIEGRVRVRDYNLMTPPLHDGPRSATIDLKNASISIPISDEERGLKAHERYLRFHEVDGAVTIAASSIQADFDAVFHGSQCKVAATITGPLKPGVTLADLTVQADLNVVALDFPDRRRSPPERRFVERWPELSKFFDHYDPHGNVDLDFRVEKAPGEKEPFVVREALITARSTDASCHIFPYRVKELTGAVEFDANGVFLRNLCGVHDSARVCVKGWMEAPHRTALAEFSISGMGVPIDDELLTSLHPQERHWIEEFGLAGRFDTDISITRARSAHKDESAPWNTAIELAFDDLSSTYAKVPVPVTHLAGRASIHRDRLEVSQARGELGTGSIQLQGFANMQENGLANLSFRIAADDVVTDQQLFASIPPEIATRLAPFHMTGCVSFESDLTYNLTAGWRHESLARLRNMELTPDDFPLPIGGALADLRMVSDDVEIVRARGFYKDAELFAKGRIGLGASDEVDLVVEAEDLLIDQQFRDAAPLSLREALADWIIEEPIDAEIRIQKPDRHVTWSGRAQLTDATIHHRSLPRALENVEASISFSSDEIHCTNARAEYAGASLDADFSVAQEDSARRGQIRIGAKGVSLDDSIRDLFPLDAQRVWDDLSPSGRMDLAVDDLSFYRADRSQPATWSVCGQAHPQGVKLSGHDVVIERGRVPFEGMLVDRLGGVALNGNLQDAAVTLYGQPLSETSASWYLVRTAAGQGRAALGEFHGKVHGGTATTQAQLHFDRRQTQYRVATSIQNIQLSSWLESWLARNPAPDDQSVGRRRDKPSDVRGVMDAQLHLAGVVNDPASRTGAGRVEIRDGYIYKLPIFLAILNVLDITIPNNDVLSEAHGQFYVTGNAIRLTDIAVTGESLSLVGTGTMSLHDQSVDLTLVNAGAGRLASVPVLAELWEGASRELVELHVTGPVSQPQVRASPFRGVTDEFKKLFQKRKPKRTLQAVKP